MTEIIIESIKMGVQIRGGKEGRIKGREIRMATEDGGGHSTDASTLLKSSSFLHRSSSLKPSDLLCFFFLLLFLCLLKLCFLLLC